MDTKLKRVLSIFMLITMFLLGACSTTVANAEQTWPLKIWKQNENGFVQTWNLHDGETGVNYVVVTTERGNGGLSCTITPRLNADGTLYTTP